MCGGTTCPRCTSRWSWGLSPRVRGNQPLLFQPGGPLRSIPACAGEPLAESVVPPTYEVYPRVCGGTTLIPFRPSSQTGLSPRVRGNLTDLIMLRRFTGSIPACAGEPATSSGPGRATRVYPRVCGGTRRAGRGARRLAGLSPRVRGNQGLTSIARRYRRSIPACAGEPRGL